MNEDRPIGVFDSGVGGLTVLREIIHQLPGESTLYFGDTARVPYGSKSKDVILRFSLEISEFLLQQKVKMIVVACNTASAFALTTLQSQFKVPIIGVIEPGAQAAVNATRSKRIGVIGTEGTIESQAYSEAIHRLNPGLEVFGQACPLIVPLVEEGWLDKPVALEIVKEYLTPLLAQKIDTLVLGCTHYPLLKDLLARVTGPSVRLIDSAEETTRRVAEALKTHALAAPVGAPAQRQFVVSDAPEKFEKTGRRFFGIRHPRGAPHRHWELVVGAMFEVIIQREFSSAHALRHYHGKTEPMHGHNFRVEVVVRGKTLQNKVKYLTDFISLQKVLDAIVKPMDHINLNEFPPFTKENPSAENLAVYIAREVKRRWQDRHARLASVTVWETAQTAARYVL